MAQSTLTKEQFFDQLNKQSQNSDVAIRDFEINSFEFPADVIQNIKFESTSWSNIDANNKKFINVTFKDCKLKNINMRNMQFVNVKFVNCELINVVMNNSKIDTVIFENSKIISTDSNIDNSYTELNSENLIFIKSELKNINFFESKGNFSFDASELSSVSGYGLKKGSSIKILDTKAIDMDFSVSDLIFVDIKDSHIIESKINDSDIGKVNLEGNTFKRFSISSGRTYGSINSIQNAELTVHGKGPVKDTLIKNCVTGTDIYIAEMEFVNINIEDCKVRDLTFSDSKGKTMIISHVNTYELDLENAEIETLILKDVRIRGKIYMQNAKVKNYEAYNVVVDDKVKNKDKGANFKIETTN
ncbi:MAG: pentapeptide repeat-containing protein [Woeseiaceae bacterium]